MGIEINNRPDLVNNTETRAPQKKQPNPFDMDTTISASKPPAPKKNRILKGTLNDGWKPENTITSLSPKEEEESHRDPFADHAKRAPVSSKQSEPAKVSKNKNPFDM